MAAKTVGAAQATLKAANSQRVKLNDMDAFTVWDGTHWNFAAGLEALNVTVGLWGGL